MERCKKRSLGKGRAGMCGSVPGKYGGCEKERNVKVSGSLNWEGAVEEGRGGSGASQGAAEAKASLGVLSGEKSQISQRAEDGRRGFPGGSVVKNLLANAGAAGSIPGLEKFPTCQLGG